MEQRLYTILSVDNIKVRANHGWYSEERKMGNNYIVHIRMHADIRPADTLDNLEATVNYEIICMRVMEVMKKEFKLIEHCCKAIFDEVKSLASQNIWEVELIKENPPVKFVAQTRFHIKG